MNDILASFLVVFPTFCLLLLLVNSLSRMEKFVWGLSLAVHVLGTIAQIWIHVDYYGYGDMLSYLREGGYLVRLMEVDFLRYFEQTIRIVLQREVHMPLFIHGVGDSTGSMAGLAGLGLLLTNGSMYGTCMIFAMTAFLGKLLMHLAVRDQIPPALRTRVAIAFALIPSVVLWSCGVIKESVAITGLGLMTFGFFWLVGTRKISGLLLILVGTGIALISKGFLILAFAVAATVWYFWRRTLRTKGVVRIFQTPWRASVAVTAAFICLLVVGVVFPRLSIETLMEQTQTLQTVGQTIEGGSNYEIVSDPTTFEGQLIGAPFALVTSLFRPLVFEAHNAMSFFNAIESTGILLMFLTLISTRGIKGTWRVITREPILVFFLTLVLILSVGVGLATTNMGTLSRYRAPMMPFYLALLFVLVPFGRSARKAASQASRTASRPKHSSA